MDNSSYLVPVPVPALKIVKSLYANPSSARHTFATQGSFLTVEASFRVSNTGVLEHNVSIQDPSGEEIALLTLLMNEHGTLQIEPATPGLWMIICTLPGHEMAGMTATLTVAP